MHNNLYTSHVTSKLYALQMNRILEKNSSKIIFLKPNYRASWSSYSSTDLFFFTPDSQVNLVAVRHILEVSFQSREVEVQVWVQLLLSSTLIPQPRIASTKNKMTSVASGRASGCKTVPVWTQMTCFSDTWRKGEGFLKWFLKKNILCFKAKNKRERIIGNNCIKPQGDLLRV